MKYDVKRANAFGRFARWFERGLRQLVAAVALLLFPHTALALDGAVVPWTTYEAEAMTTSSVILGPQYGANVAASEASGRRCVQLSSIGHYAQFTAQTDANALVLRCSVPDSSDGAGTNFTLSLYKNGTFLAKLPVTSKYSWLYGNYPFTNFPSAGAPRNFFDEVRTNGLAISAGDVLRLQKDATDTATTYLVDLVDLENVPAPLAQPANSLSVMSYGAGGTGATDDTTALVNCIAAAVAQGKTAWLPAGTYKITSSINLPSNLTLQGAGMWRTTLVGDPSLYNTPSRRVTLNGNGSNIHLSDFAIVGKLNYRNDSEPNDGLGGSYGTGSTISRIWVEHTKTGAWIVNSQGLVVDGCRFRNTIADGINLCVGMRSCIVTNCTARGTGDDGFAIWPATYTSQTYTPGLNVITHCTAQTPFLANGGAIYGGVSNRVEDCLFQDTTYGCGILISTTFAVGNNRFSGTTFAQRSTVLRCGGYDPGYTWRAAVQLCLDRTNIAGVNLNNLNISNSISDGLSIIGSAGTLSGAIAANLSIPNYGIGTTGRNGLWARSDAIGSLTVSNSTVVQYRDDSPNFSFSFVTNLASVTIQSSPPGRSFTVDGTNYTSARTFSWLAGSAHTVGTTALQTGEPGTQYAWSSWSDGGAMTHTIGVEAASTYTANFAMQYFLTMNAGPGGSVGPDGGWTNSGTTVNISATASNGYLFTGWSGSGSGSYTGGDNPAVVTMNGPVTQTASFAPIPTRLISLSGNLAFGDVPVGTATNLSFTISNGGNSTLTVTGILCPAGFSGDWSGQISPGASTNLAVSFLPTAITNYAGEVTVTSDATGGVNTLAVSGLGVAAPSPWPPAQSILGIVLNSDASVTLTYATTTGFPYHVETITDLWNSIWLVVPGSATNATGTAVSFTDSNSPAADQRYYRIVSP